MLACFVDFKKAFDSVWHDGLLNKLLRIDVGGSFYNSIKSLVNKIVTASNIACRPELGRFPLDIRINQKILELTNSSCVSVRMSRY